MYEFIIMDKTHSAYHSISGEFDLKCDTLKCENLDVTGTASTTNLTVTGSANITGAVSSATNLQGGTAGAIPYQSAPDTTQFVTGTSGQILTSNGTSAPSFQTLNLSNVSSILPESNGGTNVSSLASATVGKATNIAGGNTGDIVIQTASGTTGFVSPGAAGTVLTSNGPSSVPSFQTVSTGNLPSIVLITSSGSYTSSANTSYIEVIAIGGGGGGGGGANGSGIGGGGGGPGGTAWGFFDPGTYNVTIGTAGNRGNVNSNGTAGTATLWKDASNVTKMSAGGGSGGQQANASGSQIFGGSVGTVTGSQIPLGGAPGEAGGGRGGRGGTPAYSSIPGPIAFESTGSQVPNGAYFDTGGDGISYGYGGGGGVGSNATNSKGGAGFAGVVIITEYK